MYDKKAIYKYRKSHPGFWLSSHAARQKAAVRAAAKRYQFMNDLKNRPCADCGGWFNPWQMDFDHKNPESKAGNVSQMKSIKKIVSESQKCDLVCANCHRDRTQKRFIATGGPYVQRSLLLN